MCLSKALGCHAFFELRSSDNQPRYPSETHYNGGQVNVTHHTDWLLGEGARARGR